MKDNFTIGMSPKYKTMALTKFENKDSRDKFLALVNASHYINVLNKYSNIFFPASKDYRQQFLTAAEIQKYYMVYKEEGDLNYNFTSSVLMSYVKRGLMEVDTTTKPHTYSFPADMFVSNDLKIRFKKKERVEDF